MAWQYWGDLKRGLMLSMNVMIVGYSKILNNSNIAVRHRFMYHETNFYQREVDLTQWQCADSNIKFAEKGHISHWKTENLKSKSAVNVLHRKNSMDRTVHNFEKNAINKKKSCLETNPIWNSCLYTDTYKNQTGLYLKTKHQVQRKILCKRKKEDNCW